MCIVFVSNNTAYVRTYALLKRSVGQESNLYVAVNEHLHINELRVIKRDQGSTEISLIV